MTGEGRDSTTAEKSAEFSPSKRALTTSNMVLPGPVVSIVTKQAVGIIWYNTIQ